MALLFFGRHYLWNLGILSVVALGSIALPTRVSACSCTAAAPALHSAELHRLGCISYVTT